MPTALQSHQTIAKPQAKYVKLPKVADKITGVNKYELPKRSRKEIATNNFIGGFFWSFGAFLGIIVVGLVVGLVISKINLVPIIGDWLGNILKHATQNLRTPISS